MGFSIIDVCKNISSNVKWKHEQTAKWKNNKSGRNLFVLCDKLKSSMFGVKLI